MVLRRRRSVALAAAAARAWLLLAVGVGLAGMASARWQQVLSLAGLIAAALCMDRASRHPRNR